MSTRKKKVEEPEVMIDPDDKTSLPEPEEQTQTVPEPVVEETGTQNTPTGNRPVPKPKQTVYTPENPYTPFIELREIIRSTMMNAPKRNDGTTMPSTVNLRCATGGDMYFIMPQFEALTVQKLWDRAKKMGVSPEGFVNCLYTTMGYNPPKLYMYKNEINIV